jgi:exopolyphosphatase/guanosine-5'-triphosphate,3'-diphosphate pyrophosphatase
MLSRYQVDTAQSKRVSLTAARLLEQCRQAWKLDVDLSPKILEWAARLHEIGLDISHDGYQRHGAYIAENADMPGFPWTEQKMLAFLIASQRRQLNRRGALKLPANWRQRALRLALLLRIAVLLNRSRSSEELPDISLQARRNTIALRFPQYWLEANPLTVADLEREQGYLQQIDYRLRIESY